MIGGTINGLDALDAIQGQLARLRNPDLRPLAEQIAVIIQNDLRVDLAAGTSPSGGGFAPLAASTRRRNHGIDSTPGGGSGGSFYRDLTVSIETGTNSAALAVNVGWQGQTARKAFHFDNGVVGRQPARPLEGLSDGTRVKIQQALDDFARTLLQG